MNRSDYAHPRQHQPPLVSVVMPAFNAERTMERSVRSVLAQTYSHLELLIVDDGSTDCTRSIAGRLAQDDARVRVLRKKNGGVASARNHGLHEAASELIAPIDADDLWHPSKLSKQVAKLLASDARTAFVYTFFRVIDEQDHVVRSAPAYGLRGRVLCRHVLVNFVGNGSSILMRRSAALELGGYDVSLQLCDAYGCEDLLLQLRLASRYRVEVVPEYLVGYRRTQGSMSSDVQRMIRSYALAFSKLRGECRDVPEPAFGWGISPFIMDQALGLLRRGNLARAFALGCSALRHDAPGALTHLYTRLIEQAKEGRASRLARTAFLQPTRRPARSRRHFYELDPRDEMVKWPPHRLLTRRLVTLGLVDEQLAPPSSHTKPLGASYERALP